MACIMQQFLLLLEFQEEVGRERGSAPGPGNLPFSRVILGKDDSPVNILVALIHV